MTSEFNRAPHYTPPMTINENPTAHKSEFNRDLSPIPPILPQALFGYLNFRFSFSDFSFSEFPKNPLSDFSEFSFYSF